MTAQTPTLRAPHEVARATDVLRLAGPGRPDHLDPVRVADPATAQLARLSTRSLFGYVGDPDPLSWRPATPVADLAATVPSIYNAGIGASNRSVVVMLRPGVRWDTTPPRPVTAHDVVRGIKRLGNPVHRPAALPYLTAMIRGMAEFCAGYSAQVPPDSAAAEFAAYQNEHDIAGLLVLDDETVVFELTRPALDLVHLLALPCTAPAPVEYDAYVPGSAELRATGPYRPVRSAPGEPLRWEPNPAWRADTDPVRSRHLSGIQLGTGPSAPDELARHVRAGTIDLAWNAEVTGPAGDPPAHDPAYALDPCLVLNVRGRDANPAIRDVAVRRAVAAAIDQNVRTAVAETAAAAEPGRHALTANSLIPPGNDGHRPGHPGHRPGTAGTGPGSALTLIHPASGIGGPVARACAAALERAGIPVRPVELEPAEHRRAVRDADRESWDIALTSLHPAWAQLNSRVFVQLLAEDYDPVRPVVDRAMDAAADPAGATAAWREAEQRLLDDGVVVPLLFRTPCAPPLVSERVRDAVTLPSLAHEVDLTAVRIR